MNYYRELYFLENREEKSYRFLYGFTIECDKEIKSYPLKKKSIKKSRGKSGFNFCIKKDVVSEDTVLNRILKDNRFFYSIENCEIELDMIHRPVVYQPPAEFFTSQWGTNLFTPPESYVGELTIVETWWIIKKTDYLVLLIDNGKNLPYEELSTITRNIFLLLKEYTRLSFDAAYAGRIGNFEYIRFPSEKYDGKIRTFVSGKVGEISGNILVIERTGDVIEKSLSVNVVLRNNMDIILDKHLPFCAGDTELRIPAPEPISRYQVKVYNESGEIIFEEGYALLREIGSSLQFVDGQYNVSRPITDRILKRINDGDTKERIRKKLNEVTKTGGSLRSLIGGYKFDPWNTATSDVREFIKEGIFTFRDGSSWWFPTGAIEESECFDFLKKLIGNPDNKKVLIADPYFDIQSLSSFLPVLEGQAIEYTILTALYGMNPEVEKRETQKKQFEEVCQKNSVFFPHSFKVLTTKGSKDAVFHDRYLIIVDSNNKKVVYSLSNSLNRAAGKYPLLLTKLEMSTGEKVGDYVLNLLEGRAPDQNGIIREIDIEELWSTKKKQLSRINEKLITENGPEDYPHWKSFWELLLQVYDESELLGKLQDLNIISEENDRLRWNITQQQIETSFDKIYDLNVGLDGKQLTGVLIGLGETLARTHYTNVKELYHRVDQMAPIFNPEVYSSIMNYYGKINSSLDNMQLVFMQLLNANQFNRVILNNCQNLFSRPPLSHSYHAMDLLLEAALDVDPEGCLKWLASIDEHKYIPFSWLFRYAYYVELDSDIISILLQSPNLILRTLGAVTILNSIEYFHQYHSPQKNRSLSDAIRIFQSNGFENYDILWIFLSKSIDATVGNRTETERQRILDDYFKEIAPIYNFSPNWDQQKNIVKALDKPRIIYSFLRSVNQNGIDLQKTNFLWQSLVDKFQKFLDDDDSYFGQDENYLLDYVPEALINLNPGIAVDELFNEKFEGLLNELDRVLSQPFSFRDPSWRNCMLKSLMIMNVGYIMLIFSHQLGNEDTKEFSETLWRRFEGLVKSGLAFWPDYSHLEIKERLAHYVVYTFYNYGIPESNPVERIINSSETFPDYLRAFFIVFNRDNFTKYENQIPDLFRSHIQFKFPANSVMNLLDSWILIAYECTQRYSDIEVILDSLRENHQEKNYTTWFDYFSSIIEFLKNKDNRYEELWKKDEFSELRTLGLIKEQID